MGLLLGIVIIIAALCIAPMLFLWSINSLSELGGAVFYIDHTVWSYFLVLVLLAVVGGTNRASK